MGLSSVQASAARAVKAQQDHAKASRGDIVLVPHVSSATAMHGATTRATSYSLGMVTSVTRDGLVKAYAYYVDYAIPRYWIGLDSKQKPSSGHIAGCTVASAARFNRPVKDVLESLKQEFASIEAARDALLAFVKA